MSSCTQLVLKPEEFSIAVKAHNPPSLNIGYNTDTHLYTYEFQMDEDVIVKTEVKDSEKYLIPL